MGKRKPPIVPAVLMTPERAVRSLRILAQNSFTEPLRYEIAAVIEQLVVKAAKAEACAGAENCYAGDCAVEQLGSSSGS